LLWYAHWNPTRTLRLAARAASAIVSTDVRTFPLPSEKVVPTGQAIDVDRFACREREATEEVNAIALGRYSPAKGYDTVIGAVARVENACLRVYGPVLTEEERKHKRDLQELVTKLQIHDRVVLNDAVARADVPSLLADSDVLVNNMRSGTSDKVVYEAAAACVPAIASNPVFDDLIPPEWLFARERADELADRLRAFARLAADERAVLGRRLRERVLAAHSVDSWADTLVATAGLTASADS
jgi:glycosyltransferase involved in cell wall biosynthesis